MEEIDNFIIQTDDNEEMNKVQEFNNIYEQLKNTDIQTMVNIIQNLTTCLTKSLKTNNQTDTNNPNVIYQQEKYNFIFSTIKYKLKKFFKNYSYLSACIENGKYLQIDPLLNNYINDLIDFYYSNNFQKTPNLYFNKNGFYSTEFLNIFSEYINILDYEDVKKVLLETFETLTNKTLNLLNDFDYFLSTDYYSC